MNKKINFKIATPERVVYEAQIDQLTCSTQMGELTILPNHIPLVANLAAGELRIVATGEEKFMFVAGGFLEVRGQSEVVLLADASEHMDEIDEQRAEKARERAQKQMQEKILDSERFVESQAALERSLARLRVARRKKYKDVGKPL